MDDASLENLLLRGESDRVERKRNNSDMDRIREAVCAFANDLPNYRMPGVVFVGVEDDGACANFPITDDALLTLSHIRDDGLITPFPSIDIRVVSINACDIVALIVQPSSNPPVRYRGRTCIRVGPRRAIASPDEERQLVEKRRWGNLPFDAQPVNGASIGDLDLNRFAGEYLPSLVSSDTINQNSREVMEQLRALRLIDINDVPTVTAILMLSKIPQQWFPGATIEWRRVDGTELTDETLDERSLAGTLIDQLRSLDELIKIHVTTSLQMGQHTHVRASTYPIPALQQLIRNAVMHRTYEATTAPVRVTWYSDRVEISSPGGPFGVVTPQTFGEPGVTDYRNPTVAEALKGYGFVERFGQGIEIARRSLAQNGNPPPEFRFVPEQAPSWVHVTVRQQP